MFWFAAILALSLLVIIHEFGHYVCARMAGMHVDRFSIIGIGPVVVRLFTYRGTEFVISAIPFGAYVHIVGMEADDGDDPALAPATAPAGRANYRDRPLWARAWAIAGGPLANYAAAMLIMTSVFATVGMRQPSAGQTQAFGADSPRQRVTLTTAITQGISWPIDQTARQLGGLWRLVTRQSDDRVGGPVAIVRLIKTQAERGILDLLIFSALISTVLGLFNLLPLPALDGGRLVFLGYELITRTPANRRLEERVHAVGMICLLALIAYVTIGDIRGR